MNILEAEFSLSGIKGLTQRFPPGITTNAMGIRLLLTCYFPCDKKNTNDCWVDFYEDDTARISGDTEEKDVYLDSREFKEILLEKFGKIISYEEACHLVKKYTEALEEVTV